MDINVLNHFVTVGSEDYYFSWTPNKIFPFAPYNLLIGSEEPHH
jgi:hypothetical protein